VQASDTGRVDRVLVLAKTSWANNQVTNPPNLPNRRGNSTIFSSSTSTIKKTLYSVDHRCMLKAIIFDLDGVLVDTDEIHFRALNDALAASGLPIISEREHAAMYKGLPTKQKLWLLGDRHTLKIPAEILHHVQERKQALTLAECRTGIPVDFEKVAMLTQLRSRYKIAVCSNAKRESVIAMLKASQLFDLVDLFLGNEDVAEPKPSAEIYRKAMNTLGVLPEETLIVEDSEVGKKAARDSKAFVCAVKNTSEVNYYRVLTAISEAENVHVLIPAAGQGKRFLEAGFHYPKPLIQVRDVPMIALVLENVRSLGRPIVLLQREHCERYYADRVVQGLEPRSSVVQVDGLTEGAACTALLAESLIDTPNELILINSDQYLNYDLCAFLKDMRSRRADGGILTFPARESKWSYAATDEKGRVTRVAEKQVISPDATVGVYYFRKGRDFVKAAKRMIDKNIRVNGEFYVCPVFNELIEDGATILIHEIERAKMHGLGTPEDLALFLSSEQPTVIIELEEPAVERTSLRELHVE
jgi:HAD superfamily hydrolase (TIGR01509 family)